MNLKYLISNRYITTLRLHKIVITELIRAMLVGKLRKRGDRCHKVCHLISHQIFYFYTEEGKLRRNEFILIMNTIKIALANAFLVATFSLPQAALSEPLEVVSSSEAGNLVCYIQTDEAQTVDLTPLCSPRGSKGLLAHRGTVNYDKVPGFTPRKERTYGTGRFTRIPMVSDNPWAGWSSNGGSSGGSSGGSDGSSSGGNCDVPSDLTSNGRRCGGMAASEKPGGR